MDKELKPFPGLAAEVEAAGEILISNHEHEVGALKARIEELEAKLRWIPVGEGMSEKASDKFFLVLCENEPEVCFYEGKGQWDCPHIGVLSGVTHRMEIPELPEK